MSGREREVDYDPKTNKWVLHDHIVGAMKSFRHNFWNNIIVGCGWATAPVLFAGVLFGLVSGVSTASKGPGDMNAIGSAIGAGFVRPVISTGLNGYKTAYIDFTGAQPVATPVDYRHRNNNSQKNWAVVPTSYNENE